MKVAKKQKLSFQNSMSWGRLKLFMCSHYASEFQLAARGPHPVRDDYSIKPVKLFINLSLVTTSSPILFSLEGLQKIVIEIKLMQDKIIK
jgi:hypothetical protein